MEEARQHPPLNERARRLRGVKRHFLIMLIAMAILIPVNVAVSPSTPWWIAVLVGWGAPLAIHVAWAMELFATGEKR